MLSQAAALGLLALVAVIWPGPTAVLRLARVLTRIKSAEPHRGPFIRWHQPRTPRSSVVRVMLAGGSAVLLGQFCPLPVAGVAVALACTAVGAWMRGRQSRAAVAQDAAAVEGLGVLVAELRAGRVPADALTTAGRHCGHPAVQAVLASLARTVRMGGEPARSLEAASSPWGLRLMAGVRLSARTGCALADVVATVESDLAARAHRRAELRTSAAGHRATVGLLAGLPVLGLAMGSGIGAEPVRILTTTSMGQVLLVAGISLELLGLTWSRRLTSRALGEG